MADERGPDLDVAPTPDKRMQYGEVRRREDEGEGRGGPSPYDEATGDMPDDRVITKGEREKPGPTETSGDLGESGDNPQPGMGGMSGSLEEEEASGANEESGSLGGEAMHRRLNHERVEEDMLGDEESA
jgi:hypothetical protein